MVELCRKILAVLCRNNYFSSHHEMVATNTPNIPARQREVPVRPGAATDRRVPPTVVRRVLYCRRPYVFQCSEKTFHVSGIRLFVYCLVGILLHSKFYCQPVSGISGRRHLRSADRGHLDFPRVELASYGGRSFAYAGPSNWNLLPAHLRDSSLSLSSFKCNLKTFLFSFY